ncbi:hypothetical protein QTP70_027501 [Hemibagrus guttatus]|uniref:ribonuclease H n=1 Tax=Hemibagrus guttatus TaxID=175788 RepID=A0AAE0UWP7_9TELE|nr:hypothetical protein QTP70_027501 [Hemibagrus guttatus]
MEKTYDRVPREELWYCMRKSGVAEKYVRVVQDMYERSRTVVRCAVGQTEEFNVEVGLHQGSALSPFLFAIVMDQLSEEVRQESPWTMMFADDIVICSESREQVEENLERWRFALERRGMKVSRIQSNGECGKEVKKRVQAETVSLRKRQESELEVAELKMLRFFQITLRQKRRTTMHDFPILCTALCLGFLLSKAPGFKAETLHHDFLQDILTVYGQDRLLDINGINTLLETVSQGKPAELDTLIAHAQCGSAEEILALYGLSNLTHLDKGHLRTICPTLLNRALLPPCTLRAAEPKTYIESQVWGYGFLAVTIINLASCLGLALIPFTKKPYFPKLLTYFIGLAIGTLFSNSVLQLIPEHGHSHFSPPEVPQQNGGAVIAVTSFSISNSDKSSTTSEATVEQCLVQAVVLDHNKSVLISLSLSLSLSLALFLYVKTPPSQGCCVRLARVKTLAWMITLSDALHNFIDGLAIGASFTVSVLTGFSTSIAIVCEEFPHELGDFVILLNSGMSIRQAVLFNLLSAMSCYVGLVLGILVGSTFAPNVIFALAGGMFLYIALADMFPEMNAIAKEHQGNIKTDMVFFIIQNVGLLTGFSVILLITIFAGDINLG